MQNDNFLMMIVSVCVTFCLFCFLMKDCNLEKCASWAQRLQNPWLIDWLIDWLILEEKKDYKFWYDASYVTIWGCTMHQSKLQLGQGYVPTDRYQILHSMLPAHWISRQATKALLIHKHYQIIIITCCWRVMGQWKLYYSRPAHLGNCSAEDV